MVIEIERYNKLNLNDFEGYHWYSNAERPVLNGFKLEDGKIPFVIEGYLYNSEKNHSISIKNYNGKYLIHEFDLNNIEKNLRLSTEANTYPPYSAKLEIDNALMFKELQKEITDDSGFSYWKKVANIFVGFEKK